MTPTLGSIGAPVDLRIRQGATFGPHEVKFTNPPVAPASVGTAVDLAGCSLRGQIRRAALDEEVLASLECAITNAAAGKATFELSALTTAAIAAGEDTRDPLSHAVWDLELVDAAGRVIPVFYGSVSIFREVTRV